MYFSSSSRACKREAIETESLSAFDISEALQLHGFAHCGNDPELQFSALRKTTLGPARKQATRADRFADRDGEPIVFGLPARRTGALSGKKSPSLSPVNKPPKARV
jgi:hypothetical protein